MIGCLIIEDDCYIVNVGDSWALLSADRGKNVFVLSRDHKPSDWEEMQWIEKAGGDVYISTIKQIWSPSGQMVLQKVDRILTNQAFSSDFSK